MHWYGWIPILTSRLLIRPARSRLNENSSSILGCPREHLLNLRINNTHANHNTLSKDKYSKSFSPAIRESIKSVFNPPAGTDIYYYLRDLDDINTEILYTIVLAMDYSGRVKKIGIFEYPDPQITVVVDVIDIEQNGLVTLKLVCCQESQFYKQDFLVKQLFGELRDIYHEHVYGPHGDFQLKPVPSNDLNKEAAIDEIFWQYQNKILEYHAKAKNMIGDIEKLSYGNASLRHFHNSSDLICSACGEMVYALSFTNLFQKSKMEERSIHNAISSFQNLCKHLDHIFELRSISTNWMVLILTLMAAFIASYNLGSVLLPIYTWHFASISTLGIFLFLRLVSYSITRRRQLPVTTIRL